MTRIKVRGDSDMADLNETHRALCLERQWDQIIEEADPPHSAWVDAVLVAAVTVAAGAVCWLIYFWAWS